MCNLGLPLWTAPFSNWSSSKKACNHPNCRIYGLGKSCTWPTIFLPLANTAKYTLTRRTTQTSFVFLLWRSPSYTIIARDCPTSPGLKLQPNGGWSCAIKPTTTLSSTAKPLTQTSHTPPRHCATSIKPIWASMTRTALSKSTPTSVWRASGCKNWRKIWRIRQWLKKIGSLYSAIDYSLFIDALYILHEKYSNSALHSFYCARATRR